MRSLKIGLVLDDGLDSNDGVQQYVLTLGSWLESRGHEVHYLTGETKERSLAHLYSLSRNIAVRYNHNRMTIPLPASKSKIKKLLDREKFDLLHIQVPYSPFLAGRIINLAPAGTPIIGTFHILPYSKLSRLSIWLLARWTRRSLAKFDKMLAVSPAAAELVKQVVKPKCDVELIPNVVATQRFANAKPKYGNSKKLTILFLGRLVPRKGCQTLLEAVKLLESKVDLSKIEVMICGAGPLMPSLISYVNSSQLNNTVKFLGYVTEADKPARLASADIAVFPSSGGESFGIVLVEAMASGKSAVIAGYNPGYASVLEPELLFDAGNADALAVKLEHYILDAKIRKNKAAWGKVRARDFDVNRLGPRIEFVYRQVATTQKSKDN